MKKKRKCLTDTEMALGYFVTDGRTYHDYIIRLVDIIGAVIGLIILLLILPILAIAIKWDSSGPAIFQQKRAGKNGVIFKVYKFRTMCKDADKHERFRNANEPVVKLNNDARITKVGCFLRKCSIDELPQFINVLKGEMSLVGPRPCVLKEVEAYNDYQRGRLAGKPGITGLAQIRGRSDLNFDDIVEYDIFYNKNRTFGLYCKILLKTIPYCLFRKSSY